MTAYSKSEEKLYLFGGMTNIDTFGDDFVIFNDLWSYSIKTKEWTWISGSPIGTSSSPVSEPQPRYGGVSWFDDKDKIFYIFGGNMDNGIFITLLYNNN